MTTEQILAHYGWTIKGTSPYKVSHSDGSFATRKAARIVIDALCDRALFDGLTKKVIDL